MRPWTLAARAAVGILAAVVALVLAGCAPSLRDDLQGRQTASPPPAGATPSAAVTVAPPTASPAAGDPAYLAQLAQTLPALSADDKWKESEGHWVCLLLVSGMTLRGAATTTADFSSNRLTVADATTLARAAVTNYCPAHLPDLAQNGTAPLDATLDGNGQSACFWLDYARFLNSGGKQDGDLTLAEAVYAAGLSAKASGTAAFRSAWLTMQSDISTPPGLAERRALCERFGWRGQFGGPFVSGGGPTGPGGAGRTPTPTIVGQPA
jgi:hypothetical protein